MVLLWCCCGVGGGRARGVFGGGGVAGPCLAGRAAAAEQPGVNCVGPPH